jgi:hypothetical protein
MASFAFVFGAQRKQKGLPSPVSNCCCPWCTSTKEERSVDRTAPRAYSTAKTGIISPTRRIQAHLVVVDTLHLFLRTSDQVFYVLFHFQNDLFTRLQHGLGS